MIIAKYTTQQITNDCEVSMNAIYYGYEDTYKYIVTVYDWDTCEEIEKKYCSSEEEMQEEFNNTVKKYQDIFDSMIDE